MEPGDHSTPQPAQPTGRPVFPMSAPGRSPEHELRDRARAAKLRHKAAKARVKAKRMEDRARWLNQRADEWERHADELDGVFSPIVQAPANE